MAGTQHGSGKVPNLGELKERLSRIVSVVTTAEDDCCVDKIDEAIEVLRVVAELVEKRSGVKVKFQGKVVPDEFVCPVSRKLMMEPVVLETGQTYDRPHIQRLLGEEGPKRCPKTQHVLFDTTFVNPNHLVYRLIVKWCVDRGIKISNPVQQNFDVTVAAATNTPNTAHFESLLEKMASSRQDLKEAAKQLRKLTECGDLSFRVSFGESSGAMERLLSPFSQLSKVIAEPDLQENVVTVLLNVLVHGNNKKLVEGSPLIVSLLVESLHHGTIITKNNAAAALSELSTVNSMKIIIPEARALRPLVLLLDEGNLSVISNAISAIYNLCTIPENKRKAVRAGAVIWIICRIKDRVLVDDLLCLLASLSSDNDAVDHMKELDVVALLLGVLRETSNERSKEHCVAILHTMCFSDRRMLQEIRTDEKVNRTLWGVAESGTLRARRKATSILDRIGMVIPASETRATSQKEFQTEIKTKKSPV